MSIALKASVAVIALALTATAIGVVVTSIVGVTVYETTLAPPDKIMGTATVK